MNPITKLFLHINSENLTHIFDSLKSLYNFDSMDENKKTYIKEQVQKYGYLPYSHIKALEELTEAETIVALEEKLKLNNIYANEKFSFEPENISPVIRAGYKDSGWIKKEGHNIKLINLAGLGNGNKSSEPGSFIDWLKQLVTLPSGNIEKGILGTTMYIIPFHPRDFGCAYLPKSFDVSENLEDSLLKENINIDAKNQVRLFLALCQLAGHPIIYDILPQTGRFSKTVLAKPEIVRWFDIKDLTVKLNEEIARIALKLSQEYNFILVERAKNILQEELAGIYIPLTDDLKEIFDIFKNKLLLKKKELSNLMLSKEKQENISERVKKIICDMTGKPVNSDLTEEDIVNHGEIIEGLTKKGLWAAPGGAWCSSGVPVYDKMSEGAGYPMFRHFDNKGNDVTHFANLDCQTPYYFVYFDKSEYNRKVIDFYIDLLKKIQKDYNFDGFRVDHIDHIVDEVSEKDGFPISYRAPRKVLGLANSELKKEIPHFAALAEYMLWDNLFKEYHNDMNFDLLWGNDIICQNIKTVSKIVEENEKLEEYNKLLEKENPKLSILKTYNNQDGEFREINQYPGQLGEEGALFKWFKFKFLPGGNLSSRPVMFVDGDESFTKTGIESAIGAEKSMKRNNNYNFYKKFDAINRFALKNDILLEGKAKIIDKNEEGFISWIITSDKSKEGLFIVANEKPILETTKNSDGEFVNIENKPIYNIETIIPKDFSVISKYVLNNEDIINFCETKELKHLSENRLYFEKLYPSEFHIYKIVIN